MRILSVDFDGVVSEYPTGWQGADNIVGGPVPGAIAFLREATEHFHVNIYSSRSGQPGGIPAMQNALKAWVADDNAMRDKGDESWVSKIHWPVSKPAAFVALDDRALQFTGQWPSMETLLNFKTWQGK